MCAGAENTEFAESVIAMGKNLSLTVVAQGVESRAQAEFLRDHACDELQGFYLNRPVPPEELRNYCSQMRRKTASSWNQDPLERKV